MTGFVFPPPPQPAVAVTGCREQFPVRRIFCVGRNYAEHAREMGHDPDRDPPFFFAKPADALVASGAVIPYPPVTSDLHHEAELVAAIGKAGADIAEDQALAHVWGYAAGNDLTRRDMQAEAKSLRRPWDMAKGFDRSAVVGPLRPAGRGHVLSGTIRCTVDGVLRQSADVAVARHQSLHGLTHKAATTQFSQGAPVRRSPAGGGGLGPGFQKQAGAGGLKAG